MEEKDKEKQPSIKMTANGIKYDSKFHHVVISKNGKIKVEPKLAKFNKKESKEGSKNRLISCFKIVSISPIFTSFSDF